MPDDVTPGRFLKGVTLNLKYEMGGHRSEKDEDPTDAQCLKIEERKLLSLCGSWTTGTFACYGPRIVRLQQPGSRFDDEDTEEEEVHVEQVMDISLCKFHGIKIIQPVSSKQKNLGND